MSRKKKVVEESLEPNNDVDETPVTNEGIIATPLETKPEEFYNQPDSVYLRIQYVPNVRGYKFEVWNQLYHSLADINDLQDDHKMMMTLARGLAEIVMSDPQTVYNVGSNAQNRDFIHHNPELSDDEKKMFATPQGVA